MSPGGFSHDACRLVTPELLTVRLFSAMGTDTNTQHTHQTGQLMVTVTKCCDLIPSVNTPVLPSTDTELLRFLLMVATVMV